MKPKLLVILGPTASGKSGLAVELAKKFKGEVISADSRQVYKGLDIGTGKIAKKEMRGVPHHLLDIVSPKKIFDVTQYKKMANEAIADIVKRGKLPILCGGTGLYIDAVVKNIEYPDIKQNWELRTKLEKKSAEELFLELKKLDPKRASNIDPFNKRRLIRALEIIQATGKTIGVLKAKPKYDVLFIGIKRDPDELKKLIHERLLVRIKQGMVAEAKQLHRLGLSYKRMQGLGLEYRYLALFLQEKITKENIISELNIKIGQYAKRQMTWFKRNREIHWITSQEEAKKITQEFLQYPER